MLVLLPKESIPEKQEILAVLTQIPQGYGCEGLGSDPRMPVMGGTVEKANDECVSEQVTFGTQSCWGRSESWGECAPGSSHQVGSAGGSVTSSCTSVGEGPSPGIQALTWNQMSTSGES